MLRHNPGDQNPRLYRCEVLPTPTPQTFGPLYCLLIASLNNSLGERWHLCITINTHWWHDRTICKYVGIHSGQKKGKPAIGEHAWMWTSRRGRMLLRTSWNVKFRTMQIYTARAITLRGWNNGRGRTLLPLSMFTSGISRVTRTDPQHKVHYYLRD
jgi:hypothetical protein